MLNRRAALGVLAGATGAALLPAAANAASRRGVPAFEPSNEEHLGLAYRKLAYSLDDRLTFWWLHGTRYGVQNNTTTPLWEMHLGMWFRVRDLADGQWEVRQASAIHYTKLGGTEALEKFDNPFTGETIDLPGAKPRANTTVYDRKGHRVSGGPPSSPTTTVRNDLGPANVYGDELSVRHDGFFRMEPTEGKRAFTVQDMSTYVGRVADVMDPKVKNPRAQQWFNDILDFSPYMKMGDRAGTSFSRCYGRKEFRYVDLPATWRGIFAAKHPDVAKDPGALLAG